MKKAALSLICIVLVISMCACTGEKEVTAPYGEESTETATGIIPASVPEGSEEAKMVKETVKNYLDTFVSCDFTAIENALHQDDKWYFNFSDEEQLAFYEAILPQIEYKLEYVSEHEGVYGVMTEITSPDMAEVYGSVITSYIDATTGNSEKSADEIMKERTESMLEMIKSPELARRVNKLYVYVEYIDGKYIPRCDMYLANELTGGAPEVSDEITSTINETIDALGE
ncbi:MAG: hypothetical protein IJO83_00450 [Clostridia bacterium]|nr:hypothetical protein [Clostridia bacterium]